MLFLVLISWAPDETWKKSKQNSPDLVHLTVGIRNWTSGLSVFAVTLCDRRSPLIHIVYILFVS